MEQRPQSSQSCRVDPGAPLMSKLAAYSVFTFIFLPVTFARASPVVLIGFGQLLELRMTVSEPTLVAISAISKFGVGFAQFSFKFFHPRPGHQTRTAGRLLRREAPRGLLCGIVHSFGQGESMGLVFSTEPCRK
jgi:hypothetical protein